MIKVKRNLTENNEIINYSNRGMILENEINETAKYLLENNICLIYKKATPIKIVKVENKKIVEAYFNEESTLDYAGVYKGKYLDFEAKETEIETSFPLKNIQEHQILHMENVLKHDGYAFLIVAFTTLDKYFLLDANKLIDFIKNNGRKSIPLSFFEENSIKIERKLNPPLDLIKALDTLIFNSSTKSF